MGFEKRTSPECVCEPGVRQTILSETGTAALELDCTHPTAAPQSDCATRYVELVSPENQRVVNTSIMSNT